MPVQPYQLLSPVQSPAQWLLFARSPDSGAKCELRWGRAYISCTHRDFSISFHDTDLNVFCAGLHDLQKALDCKLDTFIACHVIFVILLQKFPNSLGRSTDGVGLATTDKLIDTTGEEYG
jgi:hypothetical protein